VHAILNPGMRYVLDPGRHPGEDKHGAYLCGDFSIEGTDKSNSCWICGRKQGTMPEMARVKDAVSRNRFVEIARAVSAATPIGQEEAAPTGALVAPDRKVDPIISNQLPQTGHIMRSVRSEAIVRKAYPAHRAAQHARLQALCCGT
jgi:hypothetical protein